MALKLLGGTSSLQTAVNDMNSNILDLKAKGLDAMPFTIMQKGTVLGTGTVGSNVTINVPHRLGYRPAALVYLSAAKDSESYALPVHLDPTIGTGVAFSTVVDYSTTTSFLFINIRLGSSSSYTATLNFKYFLLSEAAN